MRRVLGMLAGLAFIIAFHAAQAAGGPSYQDAIQPLGQIPDEVLLYQGSGCEFNTAPCTTVTSPSLRFGQPIQVNCLTVISPWQYQQCIDTSLSTPILKEYIGTTWWPLYVLDPTNGPGSVVIAAKLGVGSTTIQNGTSGYALYDNGGILGNATISALLGYAPLNPANNLNDVGNSATSFANLGTTQSYTGTGTQSAMTVTEADWNASSPGGSITIPLPTPIHDHDCRTFVNNTKQITYSMIVSGTFANGESSMSVYPGSAKFCYSSATSNWSQSL